MFLSFSALALPTAAAQTTDLVVGQFTSVADTFTVQTCCLNGTGTFQFMQVLRLPAEEQFGFVRFDLSTIFVGSSVVSANLTLWQPGFVDLGDSSLDVQVFGPAVGWDEERLTDAVWQRDPRNHPTVGGTMTVSAATTSTFVTWNVTDLVDDFVNGALPNHGFRLEGLAGKAAEVNLGTRDRPIFAERPVLTVTYFRTVPSDPGAHPLGPFIVQLGVPVDLFLAVLGILALVLTYFGLFAAHYPESVGGRTPQRGGVRRFFRGR